MNAEKNVLAEKLGSALVITINRPEARNAINAEVHTAIGLALEEAEADPDVRVVIITGAGDKAFCAGADLKAVAKGESIYPEDTTQRAWGFAGFVSHPISKPVIAAVNGFALGGGTEIALASDLIVASENSAFGLPEVKRGIAAAAGGAFRIVEQLPKKIGMELLLTGDPITAERAKELGLVNQVVPQQDLLAAALRLAKRISENAPLSVQASKRIALGISNGVIASDAHHWERTEEENSRLMASADALEGTTAFAEKRAPIWRGK
jgi:crotonobetainyl-CoA hydratase